jgi:hypothetical protein
MNRDAIWQGKGLFILKKMNFKKLVAHYQSCSNYAYWSVTGLALGFMDFH